MGGMSVLLTLWDGVSTCVAFHVPDLHISCQSIGTNTVCVMFLIVWMAASTVAPQSDSRVAIRAGAFNVHELQYE